jgi:hypothetical protein
MSAICPSAGHPKKPHSTRVYRPRRPQRTILYQVVQQHLETWLALQREDDPWQERVPGFVERDFRKYLACGILAHGFARARCADCGHDFLIAFSCKARAVCPSCNARRMVETAAHLVDHVFPHQPVRQWVLTLPKRLRYFLQHNPQIATAVLHIFLRVIEQTLRRCSPGAGPRARLGAVSFLHRFGASLNPHFHFHVLVIDGVFAPDAEGEVQFYEALRLSDDDVAAAEAAVRRRVLQCFERRGWLEPDTAEQMRHWNHRGGFSVDASVRVEAWDRAGLERLVRYAARPPFALNRLSWTDGKIPSLLYTPPRPLPDGRTALPLTPLQLLERLAALIPPPRQHRHRYHGVLAPHSPWREQVTASAANASEQTPSSPQDLQPSSHHGPGAYLWALLLARIYEVFPLLCPQCGAELRIIAFVIETPSVSRILESVGEPIDPPRLTPARGPPESPPAGDDQTPLFDPTEPEPAPDFEIDQRVRW